MEFHPDKPIYLQISDNLQDRILSSSWKEGERIPSVRELGGLLQVNPNTILRAYEHLEREDIIFNKRGIGYFVSPGAVARVKEALKKEFIGTRLPELFKNMKLLGISLEEIESIYRSQENR